MRPSELAELARDCGLCYMDLIETMEILANPEAMKSIRQFELGKSKGKDISCLDE